MTCDHHRLTGISYSDHPESNVKYYYDGRNASYKRIGCLVSVIEIGDRSLG